MRSLSAFLVATLLAAGCAQPPVDEARGEPPEGEERPPPVVRFLAWGDAGHGSPQQRATAEAARQVCARLGCDFALGLGDNVYDAGVEDIDDRDFVAKFEAPYRNLTLPFHMVLGNHDVRGNVSAQVDYTNVSEKWRMPARSYAFQAGDARFVALDLTALAEGDTSGAEALGAWLDEELAKPATWRIVFAHFQYTGSGNYGSADPPVRAFLERHVCGVADAYLAAHEHHLEWLEEQPTCKGTELVISGAASEPRALSEERVPSHFALGEKAGFFWFELRGGTLTGRVFDGEGEMLFERRVPATEARGAGSSSPPPPRSGP